jgi:hypothetical protein
LTSKKLNNYYLDRATSIEHPGRDPIDCDKRDMFLTMGLTEARL